MFRRAALGAGSAISGLFLLAAALIDTFASTTTVKAVTLGDPLHGACPTCVHQNVGRLSGHSLDIFDASGSLTEKSFYERTIKDVGDEVNSVSKGAQFEGDSFAGSLAAEVPAAFAGNTPEEAFALFNKTQLFRLADVSEKVLTRGQEEQPKRPDDIAPDLAAVRAELAKCIAAEAAARGQIAYLTKWLEDNEKLAEVALDAERNRSDGIARDLAAVRAELADHITAEASARNEIAKLTKLLESGEREWAKRLNAERVSDGKTLASLRAELADHITAEASARKEIEQLTKRLATNEKEWTTKLNAERKSSDGVARDLAAVRAELADRINVEASARRDKAELEKLIKANETEWTSRLNAELERSEVIARDLATVQAELAKRIAAEASAPPTNDFTSTIKSTSVPTDRMATVTKRDPSTSTVVALAVDEAKWMARAQFLIGQGDVAGARHFLERVAEGGSANAAFLLAETYDWRMLRALQVYGVRGDTKRAMDLYGMALAGGIDKAKERISALERAESP